MTRGAGDVIAPVFTPNVVVVLFFPRVAFQAVLRDLFGRLSLEGADLSLVSAALYVKLAGPVAGLASLHPAFPVRLLGYSAVSRPGEICKLVRVACLASLASDVVLRLVLIGRRRAWLSIVRHDCLGYRIRGHIYDPKHDPNAYECRFQNL